MLSSRTPASEPSTDHRTKPRLRGRRKTLTVASVLLALMGGVVAGSGTAVAQPVPGACTQTCNAPYPGTTRQEWNAAVEAADFWANHSIDFNQVDWSNARSYYHLDDWAGRGWPAASFGNQWFGYWHPGQGTRFVYYGGTYHDWDGALAGLEQFEGESSRNAFSSGNGRTSPYVEYDIDYYGSARSSRNARRIVRNSRTGRVYVTFDHYRSFTYMGRW
ncbi:ribonuclease domain-containing protein [Streptomyces scabiei]|uniref:ribonuclease domain-containing protein n=1 Tax=Streptomyces scabiei TaxID=1930 RepID=UPI00298FA06A|nr:ribonuclease domain-containing protein [Streptomyces scabiei]MDW8805804.1 ribonuclease domain-containing protein [Streptomyces scabiei]